MPNTKPVWVCYGGGTDSTAMLLEMVKRRERIDLITFADTGAELPHTYRMLEIMDSWLFSFGYPDITRVRYTKKNGETETLEDSIVKNKTLPSLAFGWHTCSIRFKIDPQVKFAKQFPVFQEAWAKGERVIRCIGYDASPADAKRACRPTTRFPDLDHFENRFPLREWGWDRKECLKNILSLGLPDPGKSSCYFCPARKKSEILTMKEDQPGYYRRALEIEAKALLGGKLKKVNGLGRNFAWRNIDIRI
jgi:hypothetical protein